MKPVSRTLLCRNFFLDPVLVAKLRTRALRRSRALCRSRALRRSRRSRALRCSRRSRVILFASFRFVFIKWIF